MYTDENEVKGYVSIMILLIYGLATFLKSPFRREFLTFIELISISVSTFSILIGLYLHKIGASSIGFYIGITVLISGNVIFCLFILYLYIKSQMAIISEVNNPMIF